MKPGNVRDELFIIVSRESFENLVQGVPEKPDSLKIHHIRKVLRYSGNVLANVSCGDGRILAVNLNSENLLENPGNAPKVIVSGKKISLINPGIKRKNLEVLLKKVTELGVDKITFLRSDFENFPAENADRYEKIIINSCEQSKNPIIPQIFTIRESIRSYPYENDTLYFWGDISGVGSFTGSQNDEARGYREICFINGPEGGWSEEEEKFLKNRFRSIRLSQNVLRSETAAIVAVFALKQLFAGTNNDS